MEKHAFEQVGLVIDKINQLYHNLKEGGIPPSRLERDRLKFEVMCLYDRLSELPVGASVPAATGASGPEQPRDKAPQQEALLKTGEATRDSGISPAEDQASQHLSLNDRLRQNTQELADVIKLKRDEDLRYLIDVNDRFTFIKELFDGSSEAYERTIRKLNTTQSMEIARQFIEGELAGAFDWQGKEDVVEEFINRVSLRFNS